MGVVALSALLVAGTGFYLFARTFPNFKPGMKKLQADLTILKKEMDTLSIDLVPTSTKELEALSTSQTQNAARKRFTVNGKGVFMTIFEEGLFKYAYREYNAKRGDLIIMAETEKRAFAYLGQKGQIKIVVDDQVMGIYDMATKILQSPKNKRMIAQIDSSSAEQDLLKIKGRDVASMNKLTKALSKRVFEYVVDGLSAEERAIIVAVTIFELVTLQD